MAIRIKLRDGSEALVQATMDQWQEAVRAAIHTQRSLEIEQPDGTVVVVNPQEIQYSQEDPNAAGALAERFQEAVAG